MYGAFSLCKDPFYHGPLSLCMDHFHHSTTQSKIRGATPGYNRVLEVMLRHKWPIYLILC